MKPSGGSEMDFGINFNGDMPLDQIAKGAKLAQDSGFTHIWVGESMPFIHPFPILALIAENTETITIGSGIMSAITNKCLHIYKGFATLKEAYGDRFIIGIAPGDRQNLLAECRESNKEIQLIYDCLNNMKDKNKVYIGASGPKLIEMGSRSDGLLLNYISPRFLEWGLKKMPGKVYTAAYGPSLLLPDMGLEKNALIAAGVVARGSNNVFVKEMGIEKEIREIRGIFKEKKLPELSRHREFLLENFALVGDINEIQDKIKKLDNIGMDQVVFGSPLARNMDSIEKIGNLID